MQLETLGIARSLGWKVHMRCAHGPRDGMKRVRECVYRKQLDIDTLVCTRGPNFPLSRLESRLMCPACGSRRVTVVFEPPSNRQVKVSGQRLRLDPYGCKAEFWRAGKFHPLRWLIPRLGSVTCVSVEAFDKEGRDFE
jgi:hypothetical protein